MITEHAESTNYEDEFAEMNEYLREINENIKTDSTETGDTLVEEPVPD